VHCSVKLSATIQVFALLPVGMFFTWLYSRGGCTARGGFTVSCRGWEGGYGPRTHGHSAPERHPCLHRWAGCGVRAISDHVFGYVLSGRLFHLAWGMYVCGCLKHTSVAW
jgi:hypothetical protein